MDTCGSKFYIGTSKGSLLVYNVSVVDGGNVIDLLGSSILSYKHFSFWIRMMTFPHESINAFFPRKQEKFFEKS